MPPDRRYGDDEIEEIFRIAAEDRRLTRGTTSAEAGLTLSELQAIGREAGLEPARVAEAAHALDARRGSLPRGRSLGMPTAVGRIVALPRAPTDHEWDLLLTDFRETFDAQGADKSSGRIRQWSNGNLRIFIEPTDTGTRLRLQTRKQNGELLNGIGVFGLGLGGFLMALSALGGQPDASFVGPALISITSGAALGANALRLPRWAAERERQMERLAARAVALLGGEASEPTR